MAPPVTLLAHEGSDEGKWEGEKGKSLKECHAGEPTIFAIQFYRKPRKYSMLEVSTSEGFQSKKLSKVVGEERAEIWFILAQNVSQAPDDVGKIGRMIEGVSFAVAEDEFDMLVRKEHVGGIGFHEETVERDLPEGRPGLFLVLPEEIA